MLSCRSSSTPTYLQLLAINFPLIFVPVPLPAPFELLFTVESFVHPSIEFDLSNALKMPKLQNFSIVLATKPFQPLLHSAFYLENRSTIKYFPTLQFEYIYSIYMCYSLTVYIEQWGAYPTARAKRHLHKSSDTTRTVPGGGGGEPEEAWHWMRLRMGRNGTPTK